MQTKRSNMPNSGSLFKRAKNSVSQFILENILMREKAKRVTLNFDPKTRPVEVLLSDKSIIQGRFLLWVNDPKNPDVRRVTVQFLDKEFSNTDTSFNHALHKVQRELDAQGVLLRCYGCSRNVWGSSMSSGMGVGGTAYTHYLQDKKSERVDIFDSGPDVEPCTYEDQMQFRQQWLTQNGPTKTRKETHENR